MPITIRESQDIDVEAIAAIYAKSVIAETASWEYEPPNLAEFAERRRDILSGNFPYIVACYETRVIGYAYASSYRTRVGYRFVVEDSVYVHGDFQGHGIGTQLLNALILACEQRGFRQMTAVIGDSENSGSIKLHERCGFTMVGTFKSIGFKFSRWLDSVQMVRALGEGSDSPPTESLAGRQESCQMRLESGCVAA